MQNYSCVNTEKDVFVLLGDPLGVATCLGKVLSVEGRWQRR